MRKAALTLSCAWAITAASCSTRDNREAKKRVFSPEPQLTPSQKLAADKLDIAHLGSDPALEHRVLRMDAGEAFERLGPFKYQATVSFEWTMGTDTVKLSEDHLLLCGPHGDFHAKITNDQEQGMELIRFADTVYGRSRALKGAPEYRVRRLDRGHADEQRDEAFSALRTFYDTVNSRVGLNAASDSTQISRPAKQFGVFLSDKAPQKEDLGLPPVVPPKEGRPEATRRRFQFVDRREPRVVTGTVWIDEATGVPVKSELHAEIVAPGEKGQEAHLALEVKTAIVALGDTVSVTPPKKSLPDEIRPSGVAAALERFGLSGVDGGVKLREQESEEE